MKPISITVCYLGALIACFKAAHTFHIAGAFFACCFVAVAGGWVVAVIERTKE